MHQNQTTIDNYHTEDEYTKLANAIILQAVKDYRDALRRLAKHPYNNMALSEKQEVERFFRSDWFEVLTSIDPEMLIRKLNAEVA
ncbi:hypothetical protein EAL2_c05240 [Peptoclostridium acidaminophilum DSM 3953]|uniref:Uncharacterized protein n=1 Tax=Peptoclostridium acidaminophilum DSM 3953 TaxID=1286171 RepID=W8U4D9_PEPAC|nr:hypothetical protein [Peptoclostridium acidaminophilum]AHM55826.1 hypothetical protein EAL2_c05240 [Peptoclostridium acidaminophilum DSM 3953]NLI93485.1 hypothetical protein [Peptococcaceae bacterium]